MNLRQDVPLSTLTTLRVGGPAAFVAECESVEDIKATFVLARERGLSAFVIGQGSNLLASDDGFAGVIVKPLLAEGTYALSFAEDGDAVVLSAGAGIAWDALVEAAAARGLWGIENLAGIPGTAGAAPVQNIGAYGAELSDSLAYVDVYDPAQDSSYRLRADECALGYRDSRFKRAPQLVIMRIGLRLSAVPVPRLSYRDLQEAAAAGTSLSTPAEIGAAVRRIRAGKFPDLARTGTAGSFFKNPVIENDAYTALAARYPGLPGFPASGGTKVPLAWVLDRILSLRGFAHGFARLFEKQPLVLVADSGATARDVAALADEVAARVHEATGIVIEREVRTLA